MKKTLGGDRLGSGKRQEIDLHNYGRSTHDLGYIYRTTMSSGTLVPFIVQLALPGDTFDIELDCDIKTHPTVGPLFASFKAQLDIFQAPIRLYQGALHNNKLGIGLNMASVKLPIVELYANPVDLTETQKDLDNSQINPSCILNYLGIRGVGTVDDTIETDPVKRNFNGIPWLAYWDIYKNYYANKQEEIGAVIHTPYQAAVTLVTAFNVNGVDIQQAPASTPRNMPAGTEIEITHTAAQPINQLTVFTSLTPFQINAAELGTILSKTATSTIIEYDHARYGTLTAINWQYNTANEIVAGPIEVKTFDLANIDSMRENILAATGTASAFIINNSAGAPDTALEPWQFVLDGMKQVTGFKPMLASQEGLAIKTYQSDLFNNWLQTEWIDGTGGISEVTAIDTSGGSFTIDTLQLSRKVYDMLNRIAVSGGSYDDWMDAVYTHDRYMRCETPMYMGGLSKELIFEEVVSTSESGEDNQGAQPLGTLAGKGKLSQKHKGGKITVKVDEPSYIIGLISLTPRIDYSQGNAWDTHLLTMDDLHKPALDEIGFQELITEQMAFWNTHYDGTNWITKSAGKQPAWINYMTNINKTYGNFAIEDNEMFMTLNRRYSPTAEDNTFTIDDLTTYIDPSKYNNTFAETSLDSQNFWTQIAVDITARRKISAKLMPNL